MKALRLIVAVTIAISLLAISLGVTEGSLANDNSNGIIYPAVSTQVSVPIPNSSGVDRWRAEGDSVASSALTARMPAIQSKVLTLNDPYYDKQWSLSQIQVQMLWQITLGDRDTLVAILDTGIDQNHEELNNQVVAEVNFTGSPTPDDIYGHGTHIAGIIAANSNNGIGIVGMAPESRLLNVKVADDRGRSQASTVAKGIIWAVDNGASVINISVEFREPSSELEDAVNYAWSQGAIIIAAAGNDGNQSPIYPAYYQNVIAVAATKSDNTLAPLSNYGNWVDVAAPGFNIYSTLPDDAYGYKSGTSFATAYVSGLATLLFSVVTDTNSDGKLNDEVRAAIEAGSQEIGVTGIAAGRIDAANSLLLLSSIYLIALQPQE